MYAIKHELKHNTQTSQYMVFGSGRRTALLEITLNSMRLHKTFRFKYVEHNLTTDLKVNSYIERERRVRRSGRI